MKRAWSMKEARQVLVDENEIAINWGCLQDGEESVDIS
jgi:hypothetical protein